MEVARSTGARGCAQVSCAARPEDIRSKGHSEQVCVIVGIILVDACEALRYLTIRVNRSAKGRFALLFLVVVGWFCGKRHNTVGDF